MKSFLQDLRKNSVAAHLLPLGLFMASMSLLDAVKVKNPELPWWKNHAELWFWPLQAILCLSVIFWFRKHYHWGPNQADRQFRPSLPPLGKTQKLRDFSLAAILALVGIAIWVAPAQLLSLFNLSLTEETSPWKWIGMAPRIEGYDPWSDYADKPALLGLALFFRYLRGVIVVAFVEEICWRGWFQRASHHWDEPFQSNPLTRFSWKGCLLVTLLFMMVHAPVDWLGAFCYGILTYFLAYKTGSLLACIFMHACANLFLFLYIAATGQIGYW